MNLNDYFESTWQARTGLYHYRERSTGMSLAGKVLLRQLGSGTAETKLKFGGPIRLLVEVQTQNPAAKRPQIRIHEFSSKPADEVLESSVQASSAEAIHALEGMHPL